MNHEKQYLTLGGEKYLVKFDPKELRSMSKYLRKEGITDKEIIKHMRESCGSIIDASNREAILKERLKREVITEEQYFAASTDIAFSIQRIPIDIMGILIYFGLSENNEALKAGLSWDLIDEWMKEDAFMNEDFVANTGAIVNAYLVTCPSTATLFRALNGEKIEEIQDDIQRRAEGIVDREERAAKKLKPKKAAKKVRKKSSSASRKKATSTSITS